MKRSPTTITACGLVLAGCLNSQATRDQVTADAASIHVLEGVGTSEACLTALLRAAALAPEDSEIRQQLSALFYQFGHTDQAIEQY